MVRGRGSDGPEIVTEILYKVLRDAADANRAQWRKLRSRRNAWEFPPSYLSKVAGQSRAIGVPAAAVIPHRRAVGLFVALKASVGWYVSIRSNPAFAGTLDELRA